MIVLTIILSVVLVIEGVAAGLWFPGFFNVGKGLFGSGHGDSSPKSKIHCRIDYRDKADVRIRANSQKSIEQAGFLC